jgi:hypothetical protein
MELKNANPNSENVGGSNLINVNFLIFEDCEIWVQKQRSYVIFSTIYHDCLKNKITHIVHLTNQHWMNQSFPCIYGSILQERKIKIFFGSFSSVFVATRTTRKKCLWNHNFFSKDPVEKKEKRKKEYSYKACTYPHLQKKIQKISMKIDIIRSCPNFQLSLIGTLV